MPHLLQELNEQNFGKIIALQGHQKHTKLMMQSLALKLAKSYPITIVDTNSSLKPIHINSLKHATLATPFTLEEFHSLTSQSIDSRVLIITSLDHLCYDTSVSPADLGFLLNDITQRLRYLTEVRGLLILTTLTNNPTARGEQVRSLLSPVLDFHTSL